MTLHELIAQYRAEHELSQRQFASLCSLSNGYISLLEKGGINPKTGEPFEITLQSLKKLAVGMGISLSDLIAAADDMPILLSEESGDEIVADLPDGLLPFPDTKKIPRLGQIACGAPILAEQNIEAYDNVPENIHCDFTLACKGDSMINARIFDGDIVCIRRQPDVENGEIAAVVVGAEEATLKRVKRYEDRLILEPENPMYKPQVFWEEEMNDVRILGKATHCISTVR